MSSFDQLAKDWDENPDRRALASQLRETLISAYPGRHWKTALEYGSGTGINGLALADLIDQMHFIDSSPGMLQVLQQKLEILPGQYSTELGDWTKGDTQISSEYDFILSVLTLHHIQNIPTLVIRLAQSLKRGGTLVLLDLQPEDGSFHPPGVQGVYHHGVDPHIIASILTERGWTVDIEEDYYTIQKEEKAFPIFLLTAEKIEV
jgi:predicted TPR repeat methyltransferase